MAIVVTELESGASPTDAGAAKTGSFTPPADTLILMAVETARGGGVIDPPTLDGTENNLTWERITGGFVSGTLRRLDVFRATTSSPSSGQTQINVPSGVTGIHWGWKIVAVSDTDLSGTNGDSAIVQAVAGTTASTATPSVTLAAFADATNNAAIGFFSRVGTSTFTPGLANEIGTEQALSSPPGALAGTWQVGEALSVGGTWGDSSSTVGIALEIRAVSSGGTTTPKSVDGTLSMTGALTKQTSKSAAGTLTSAGVITRSISLFRAGTITSTGTVTKHTTKSFSGSASFAGALATVRVVLISLVGTLTSSGSLGKRTSKSLSGALTTAGNVVKFIPKSLGGTLGSSGALTKLPNKSLGGTLAPTGSITKSISKVLSATLNFIGTVTGLLNPGSAPSFKSLMRFFNLQIFLNVKRENDGGEIEALSSDTNGTSVSFNKVFKDIESITATAKSTTEPFIVIIDFLDVPEPSGFSVYVFDTTGNRVSQTIEWKARGIV